MDPRGPAEQGNHLDDAGLRTLTLTLTLSLWAWAFYTSI